MYIKTASYLANVSLICIAIVGGQERFIEKEPIGQVDALAAVVVGVVVVVTVLLSDFGT